MSEPTRQGKGHESKPPRSITDFAGEFLADDAVALVIKQQLAPDDIENPVIFPPTYLPARGATAQDAAEGDEEKKKKQNREQQKAIYNLDDLGEGRNVVEVDSPQSDGNRTEPLFKSEQLRKLVPQIEIGVGSQTRNILDAGHRAADALVRFSSLAAEFHAAFERTRMSPPDHSSLASLAPTSLLYGAYDSRSTQSKLQRILKASVRAENVRLLQKSATFIPVVDYVAVGAIKEELDVGEGESNPLSSEGMKYALASQTLGGVRLTDPKLLVRTIKINLTALRQLNAVADPPKPEEGAPEERRREIEGLTRTAPDRSKRRTEALRKYILGLALTIAKATPELNLREGCNLRISGKTDKWILIKHRKGDEEVSVDGVERFATEWARAFFTEMNIEFERKDRLDVVFEGGVANEFLAMDKADRDKIRARGPITRPRLDEYKREKKKREKSGNPIEALWKLVNDLTLTKRGTFNKAPREKLAKRLTEIEGDEESGNDLKALASRIKPLLTEDAGAEARKGQMLALFPAVPEQPASTPAEVSGEPTEEAPQ